MLLASVSAGFTLGAIPRTEWLAGLVERDEQGYIVSGQHLIREGRRPAGWTADRDPFYLETASVPGIFVVRRTPPGHRSAKGVTSGVKAKAPWR